MINHRGNFHSYLLLLLIGILWSSQFALNNIALQSMSPITIATGRTLIGFLALCCYTTLLSSAKQIHNKSLKSIIGLYLLIAICEAICPLFLVAWGLKYVNSSIAAVLMGTVPIFTMCIAAIFKPNNKLNKNTVFGIIIGFIAIMILVAPNLRTSNTFSLFGITAILIGSLSFAISLTLINLLPIEINPVIHMRNILGIATVILFITIGVTGNITIHFTMSSLTALIILGGLCTGIVYAMFIILIQKTSAVFASTINYLIPIIGVIIGSIFMGDHLSWNVILSLFVIFIALYKIKF